MFDDIPITPVGPAVYGLVSEMPVASKIVKTARQNHMHARIFDRPKALLEAAGQKKPCIVFLDCQGREAQSFEILKSFATNADLEGVTVIGYVSQSKAALKEEAEKAGCLRVYLKTEFLRELESLIVRFAK